MEATSMPFRRRGRISRSRPAAAISADLATRMPKRRQSTPRPALHSNTTLMLERLRGFAAAG